ncbi:MAG: cysteine desulfurase family protein [Alphaproteobacteria bacterium]|nr:cysteine desulfurase family protein [Alphaproteobacteria bacterium]
MIYLDYPASTPLDPSVLAAMLPYFSEDFANPHASQHEMGWRAEEAVFLAQRQIAATIGASPQEIIFTSGATEANNLAIIGLFSGAGSLAQSHESCEILLSGYEHDSVTEAAFFVAAQRRHLRVRSVFPASTGLGSADGRITPELLQQCLTPETKFVSIMAVQNEFGTVNPIKELGEFLHQRGIIFHVDAAQALARIDLSQCADFVDLLSFSAHKAYGPKGIGALYLNRNSGLNLQPIILGGGQQNQMRAGTIPVPLAVGFGKAATIAQQNFAEEEMRQRKLAHKLWQILSEALPDLAVNGVAMDRLSDASSQRVAGILNLRFKGVAASDLLAHSARRLAMSSGSACHAARQTPSPSLLALGLTPQHALHSLRIGLGRTTSEADMIAAAAHIIASCQEIGA